MNQSSPTPASTGTATSAAMRMATSSPTAAATPFPKPTPKLSVEQTCDNVVAQGRFGLYVLYVQPSQKLAWDMAPRQFTVGLCNSLAVPLVPESHFVVSVRIPFRKEGGGQTSELVAQLPPGFHELTLGAWTPGLESHVTICVQKAAVEVIVGYSDQDRSSNFRPLEYPDGKDRLILPIECGGDYA